MEWTKYKTNPLRADSAGDFCGKRGAARGSALKAEPHKAAALPPPAAFGFRRMRRAARVRTAVFVGVGDIAGIEKAAENADEGRSSLECENLQAATLFICHKAIQGYSARHAVLPERQNRIGRRRSRRLPHSAFAECGAPRGCERRRLSEWEILRGLRKPPECGKARLYPNAAAS